MIKVIAILDNSIGAGGGFDQALNAIIQIKRLSQNRFEFWVFTTHSKNLDLLNNLGIDASLLKITIFDKFLIKQPKSIFLRLLRRCIQLISPFEKELIKRGCDLVYFTTPSFLPMALQKTCYINTVWDICHREFPEFPEVSNFNEYFIREEIYNYTFGPALLTLTDSKRLADMASQYYGVERNRFVVMPFSPSPFIKQISSIKAKDNFNKYNLDADYFYYPAQFWPHKNHIRILQALVKLRESHNHKPSVVFSGKDYGNLLHIREFIKANALEAQVNILGFVPYEDMRSLYEGALAIVMPTYFGPTNLPPLEAWTLGVPLIYSAHLNEQAGNAALLIDPDSSDELSAAMLQCMKPKVRNQLVRRGFKRLLEINRQRAASEDRLCEVLDIFATRRECWK